MSKLSLNLLDQLSERDCTKTPDFLSLKTDDKIPVFVYGSLKAGHKTHEMIDHCEYLGRGRTIAGDFDLRSPHHNAFPIAFRNGQKETPKECLGKVVGELYVLGPKDMLALDQYENNGTMYRREKVWIVCKDQRIPQSKNEHARPTIQAWMYIAEKDYWRDQSTQRCPYMIEGIHKEFFWSQKY